jgi:FtsP/CotA-like multicopper oxidase with cupredoxin domain
VVPVTPDVPNLASEVEGSTRRFDVTATVFIQQLATFPVQTAEVWGYEDNLSDAGPSTPGPTAIVYEDEEVEFTVTNELDEPTTVHFHGLHAPNDADGVAGISQPEPIQRETATPTGCRATRWMSIRPRQASSTLNMDRRHRG